MTDKLRLGGLNLQSCVLDAMLSVGFAQPNSKLRWFKLVLTLERNVLIRRIDTTTLYHLTTMLWYHIKHQLLLKKIRSFLRRKKFPWQQESPAKTPYILALVAHISKTNTVTPIFFG